jgi:alginate O-acetyltransferase complex protein AlgI
MIFNSLPFLIFFTLFFLLYWLVFNHNLKLQNLLLLAGCYFFYAVCDLHFLALLIIYSFINYLLGHSIYKAQSAAAKSWLSRLGALVGIGALAYFKYTNFFITSFQQLFAHLGIGLSLHTLSILLPIGISFYTFRTLSYLIDIKNGKMQPSTDWVVFFSFVAFFPCMLAGPIDRARILIPQLEKKRRFNYDSAADAMRQILWGLFKKAVIADNLSVITDNVFANYHSLPASSLLIGLFYYTIQIYADFSGYSDMAIGVGRLLGFEVAQNFSYPFFAQNIAEYWRKWHISLTTWLTDYVFLPLSITFRNYDKLGLAMAIIINFTLIGIWHGANLTFVLFGILHGCYYIPLVIKGTINKKKKLDLNKALPSRGEFMNMLGTFLQVMLGLILFRSATVHDAFAFAGHLFSRSIFAAPVGMRLYYIALIFALLAFEWIQRGKTHPLQIQNIRPLAARWSIYLVLLVISLLCISASLQVNTGFIYVKF